MKRIVSRRTVARKSSIGGLCVCAKGFTFVQRGAWHSKLHWFRTFHISILGGLELYLGDKPTKAHRGDGTGFTSQLAPHSLSPVLCWEFSVACYIDWLIVLSNMTQHACDKVVLRRNSRRGSAVPRNNFSCEVREWHHVCENFGGGNCPVCPFLVAVLPWNDKQYKDRNNLTTLSFPFPEKYPSLLLLFILTTFNMMHFCSCAFYIWNLP